MKKIIVPVFLFCILLLNSAVHSDDKKIIDSQMTYDEAMRNVNQECPDEIFNRQSLIDIVYYGYDGRIHMGQLVMDYRLGDDIQTVFRFALKIKFPIWHAIPISHEKYYNGREWDDNLSMADNNTSGFNYRKAYQQKNLSKHAFGFALDINPFDNPYVTRKFSVPPGAVYDKSRKGTLFGTHPLVMEFKRLGWVWGGDWSTSKDYQHFQKIPPDKSDIEYKKYFHWEY